MQNSMTLNDTDMPLRIVELALILIAIGFCDIGLAKPDIRCAGGGSCPAGTTCCPTYGGPGCCPLPKAVCCVDLMHCCPKGYTCDLKEKQGCVRLRSSIGLV